MSTNVRYVFVNVSTRRLARAELRSGQIQSPSGGPRALQRRACSTKPYVETHRGALAGVVLSAEPTNRDPLTFQRREAVCSSAWRERFEDPVCWPRALRSEP